MPVDDEGIVTDAVRARLEALRRQGRRCKVIYTIVNFQNPAGPTQSLRRRQELVALAHEFDTLILEDDAYGELRFDGEMLPSLYELDKHQRVIRAGTLSKILAPGLRVGYIVAPRPVLANIAAIRSLFDIQGDLATEAAIAALMEDGELQRHVARARRVVTN